PFLSNGQGVPELMHFKFDAAVGGVIPNDAPVATRVCPSGTIVGSQLSVSGTGQFGTGLAAAAMTSSSTDYVNTGWTTNLTGSWTISLWLNVPNPPTTRYYFGDNTAGSLRCFTGGAASTGLRLTGPFTITTTTIQPGPAVVHYVYDAPAGTISAYINGVFNVSINVSTSLVVAGTTGPFKIGGYNTGNGYEGIIDEFRMYNRALTQTEITNTWNQQLPLGPPCNDPTGVAASGITAGSANLSWNAVTGATGYEYAVNTSATPPASGTQQAGTTYNATGLTQGTNYYFHVRTTCSPTSSSSWVTIPFTTLTCTSPGTPTSSSVTSNSASFSWGAVSGAQGYEYILTNSSAPPTGSGTATTTTSHTAINLTDNTNYCLHVRTECSAGVYSAWVNTCVTTLVAPPCPGPDTLNVTNITS